ncbi:MAG: hypothetical protein ACK553_09820 [Planctomycetota bacterium]|jgi:hypothetical protein
MAKFYVDSGSFRGIVDAADAEMAAVWAIHRVMTTSPSRPHSQTTVPQTTVPQTNNTDEADQGLFRLADEIRISERGFGRTDAQKTPTSHAVERWAQLVCAAEKILGENG